MVILYNYSNAFGFTAWEFVSMLFVHPQAWHQVVLGAALMSPEPPENRKSTASSMQIPDTYKDGRLQPRFNRIYIEVLSVIAQQLHGDQCV